MGVEHLQYLSFELSPTCNLAKEHLWCPVNDHLRYPEHEGRKVCPDDIIIRFAKAVYNRGFNGFIAFHYYCDPLMNLNRLFYIMQNIKIFLPQSKFNLWTNGVLLEQSSRNWLPSFNQVIITLHRSYDKERLEKIIQGLPNVGFHDGEHDDRKSIYDCDKSLPGYCLRPYQVELPVNYYGNVRLCCAEYRGVVSIGNIQTEGDDAVIDNFVETGNSVREGNVQICSKCRALPRSSVVL